MIHFETVPHYVMLYIDVILQHSMSKITKENLHMTL